MTLSFLYPERFFPSRDLLTYKTCFGYKKSRSCFLPNGKEVVTLTGYRQERSCCLGEKSRCNIPGYPMMHLLLSDMDLRCAGAISSRFVFEEPSNKLKGGVVPTGKNVR